MTFKLMCLTPLFDMTINRTSFEIRRYVYTGSYRVILCTGMYNNNDDL